MKIVIKSIVLMLIFSKSLLAQNLVSNPSFEGNSGCPEKNGDIKKCTSWSTTSITSTPDYFHKCYQTEKMDGVNIGVPSNSEGFRNPVSGDAYMGLALFFKKNYNTREYIQNVLLQPLQKGVKYKLSFYISLSDSSEYLSDHIAVDFSVIPNGMMANAPDALLTARHLITIKNQEAMQSTTWTKVETEFIAEGGEEYMIIGSFRVNMNEKEFKKQLRNARLPCKDNECAAYYFIDDVVLEEVVVEKMNPKFR